MWFRRRAPFDLRAHVSTAQAYIRAHRPPASRPADETIRCSRRVADADDLATGYLAWAEQHIAGQSFAQRVLGYMSRKALSPGAVCRRGQIDRRLFSKLNTDLCYTPRRDTALRYCFALELTPKEAEELLLSAGYALSTGSACDLALRYCLEQRIHDLHAVNQLLYALGEQPLA